MLKTTLSKKNGAIEIWGTSDDLSQLYEFVHRVVDSDAPFSGGAGEWVLSLAYDIRKARDKQRKFSRDKDLHDEIVTRYGFETELPYWIIYVGVLRCCVGWTRSELDQSIMYELEALTRIALGKELSACTVDRIMKQSMSFVPAMTERIIAPAFHATAYYLSLTPKRRFKNLLGVIQSLHPIMLSVKPSEDVQLWPKSQEEAEIIWETAKR